MLCDRFEDRRNCIAGRVPTPRDRLLDFEYGDLRPSAAVELHQIGHLDGARGSGLRRQISAQLGRPRHRRRQAERHGIGCYRTQPRNVECQQVAALRRAQRVQFVEHDGVEIGEHVRAISMTEQQDELLGRRHQDVGWPHPLSLTAADGCVAAPRLRTNFQPHLLDGDHQVTGNVDREGLKGGDIERVQTRAFALAPGLRQADQARQEAGQRLAGPRRSDQQRRAPLRSRAHHGKLMRAWRPAPGVKPLGKWGS